MVNELKERFENKYVRIDQLKRYVVLNIITEDEFKKICGDDYKKR